MTSYHRYFILTAATLALSACKGEQKSSGNTAGGQILPGSTSDAMLPLDTVRSQPPLAPKTESTGKPEKGQSPGKTAASDAAGPEPTNSAATVEVPAAPTPEE